MRHSAGAFADFDRSGGYLEKGEDRLATAKRELEEEMGLAAETWIDLGTFVAGGRSSSSPRYRRLASVCAWLQRVL